MKAVSQLDATKVLILLVNKTKITKYKFILSIYIKTLTIVKLLIAIKIEFGRGQRFWQQQPQHSRLRNRFFYGHFSEQRAISGDACFYQCKINQKCAAACFNYPIQCLLYKFGFEKVATCTCHLTFTKPEAKTEISNHTYLNETFHRVRPSIKLTGQYMNTGDVLKPSLCFNECKKSVRCGAASFTIDPRQPVNCMLFQPNQYTESSQVNELWTSYIKENITSTTTSSLNETSDINKNTFHGYYQHYTTAKAEDCAQKCIADHKCASTCFNAPALCLLFKFGFEKVANRSCNSTFIKSEVKTEIANLGKLGSDSFLTIKLKTKLAGPFMNKSDALTPSLCFELCKNNTECAAVSFTVDPAEPANCVLFQPGNHTVVSEVNELWSSFTKPSSNSHFKLDSPHTKSSANFSNTTSQNQTLKHRLVLTHTRLTGLSTASRAVSEDSCFSKCESNSKCAAAGYFNKKSSSSSSSPTCFFFKFGFEQRYPSRGWTAFVKPEVSDDMANMDTLTEKFPFVYLDTRYANSYGRFNALAPSECFKACQQSARCGAASFTTNASWSENCLLFKQDDFRTTSEDAELWISYLKKSSAPLTTTGDASLQIASVEPDKEITPATSSTTISSHFNAVFLPSTAPLTAELFVQDNPFTSSMLDET
jgi:hypothetical protein